MPKMPKVPKVPKMPKMFRRIDQTDLGMISLINASYNHQSKAGLSCLNRKGTINA